MAVTGNKFFLKDIIKMVEEGSNEPFQAIKNKNLVCNAKTDLLPQFENL